MLKCIHVTNTVFFSTMSYGVDEEVKLPTSLSQRKSFTSTKIFKALCSRTVCADLEHRLTICCCYNKENVFVCATMQFQF